MATSNDKFKRLARKWVGSIGAGGVADGTVTTIPLTSSSGLPTDTAVVATIDRVDANGIATPSLEESVVGVVSGDNLVTCTRGAEGTAQAHSAGAVVEILFTNKVWGDLIDGILVQHDQSGLHTNITACNVTASGTVSTDVVAEKTTDAGVTVDGVKLKDSTVTTDTISEKTADAGVTVDGLKIKDGRVVSWDGWMPADETWTYVSADSPTFTITVPSDARNKYSPGMRLKLTHGGSTKYFIVTAVAETTLTLYGGTDYTLSDSAITNPYYSTQKAPLGFPLSPAKWTVSYSISSDEIISTPTSDVWYNKYSLSCPIGIWRPFYVTYFQAPVGTAILSNWVTLSTANNSESKKAYTDHWNLSMGEISSGEYVRRKFCIGSMELITATTKTVYYLNYKTITNGTPPDITILNTIIPTTISFECVYL